MKKFALVGVAVAALVAVPAIAQFQNDSPERGSVTRAQTEAMVEAAFGRIDADANGAITEEEAGEAHKAMREHRIERRGNASERADERFAEMDADDDGEISRAEFDAHIAARAEQRSERRAERGEKRMGEHHGMRGMHGLAMRGASFERADSDGNGAVTLDEATAHVLARFDQADANRDGILTREERREARQARRPARS